MIPGEHIPHSNEQDLFQELAEIELADRKMALEQARHQIMRVRRLQPGNTRAELFHSTYVDIAERRVLIFDAKYKDRGYMTYIIVNDEYSPDESTRQVDIREFIVSADFSGITCARTSMEKPVLAGWDWQAETGPYLLRSSNKIKTLRGEKNRVFLPTVSSEMCLNLKLYEQNLLPMSCLRCYFRYHAERMNHMSAGWPRIIRYT